MSKTRTGPPLSSPVAMAVLGVLGVTVYAVAVLGPLTGVAGRVGRDARSKAMRLRAVEASLAQEVSLRRDHARLAENAAAIQAEMPTERNIAAVVSMLSDLATQSGVKIQIIAPQQTNEAPAPSAKAPKAAKASKASASAKSSKAAAPAPAPPAPAAVPSLYRGIPIRIEARAGFHALGAFVSRIETDPRPMSVTALRISQNSREPRLHAVKLTVVAYVLRASPAGAGAVQPAAPAASPRG